MFKQTFLKKSSTVICVLPFKSFSAYLKESGLIWLLTNSTDNVPALSAKLLQYPFPSLLFSTYLVFQLHTSWLPLCSVLAAQVWTINWCEFKWPVVPCKFISRRSPVLEAPCQYSHLSETARTLTPELEPAGSALTLQAPSREHLRNKWIVSKRNSLMQNSDILTVNMRRVLYHPYRHSSLDV